MRYVCTSWPLHPQHRDFLRITMTLWQEGRADLGEFTLHGGEGCSHRNIKRLVTCPQSGGREQQMQWMSFAAPTSFLFNPGHCAAQVRGVPSCVGEAPWKCLHRRPSRLFQMHHLPSSLFDRRSHTLEPWLLLAVSPSHGC